MATTASLEADVERALQRWREVTAPLDDVVASASVSTASFGASARRAWSHVDFAARVASFGVASWFAKPLSISPLTCARHGWRNTQPDMVQCTSCARVLCMKIDAKLSPAGAEAVAAAFARQLEDAHEESCPWRHNPSPASFTMLPVLGSAQVAQTLKQRIVKLVDAAKSSSQLHSALTTTTTKENDLKKVLEKAEISTKQELVDIVLKALAAEDVDESVVLTTTLLAVGGWGFHTDSGDSADHVVVSCAYCNRYVPLAVNEPVAVSPRAREDVDEAKDDSQEPSAKRRKTTQAEPSVFDPIGAHRWFCPWLVPQRRRDVDDDRLRAVENLLAGAKDPQSKTPSLTEFVGLPGWIQNAQALKLLDDAVTPSSLPQRAPREALASVQSVLSLPDSTY